MWTPFIQQEQALLQDTHESELWEHVSFLLGFTNRHGRLEENHIKHIWANYSKPAEQLKKPYFPLNPGSLIGILKIVHEKHPI